MALIIIIPLLASIGWYLFNPIDGVCRFDEYINKGHTGDLGFLLESWSHFFKQYRTRSGYITVRFKYYGGTWELRGASSLYWVHNNFNEKIDQPTYKANWNYFRQDFRSMIHIMRNHPNLQHIKLTKEDKKPVIIK